MQGTVASVQQDMQQRLEEALAENKAQAESLREARERNMHFSARVVALNSRVAQLTKQVESSLWQPLRTAHLLLPFLNTLIHTHMHTYPQTHASVPSMRRCWVYASTCDFSSSNALHNADSKHCTPWFHVVNSIGY